MLIGIDEAGRGPLAGPVAVGLVYLPLDFNIREAFPGVADSKLLTEQKRDALFERLLIFHKRGILAYTVSLVSPEVIDTIGIVAAVEQGIVQGLRRLKAHPEDTFVQLDGLLHAPKRYSQQTIIKGDVTEPAISLASIAAKVTRDRRMCSLARLYPEYGFAMHKGYGTKMHRKALKRFGLSDIHRKSFCKQFTTKR